MGTECAREGVRVNAWLIIGGVGIAVLALSRQSAAGQAPADPIVPGDNTGSDMGGITPGIRTMALAIAHAEGFGIAGAIPTRANNPGDLVIGNWAGATLGAQRIAVFNSPADGWDRLHRQLQLILSGRSHVYTVDMTIAEMAAKWTSTQGEAWIANVLEYLQAHEYEWVDADTAIGDVLA